MARHHHSFTRHFHRGNRKALHDRLAREDPDYVPPPPSTPRDLLF